MQAGCRLCLAITNLSQFVVLEDLTTYISQLIPETELDFNAAKTLLPESLRELRLSDNFGERIGPYI